MLYEVITDFLVQSQRLVGEKHLRLRLAGDSYGADAIQDFEIFLFIQKGKVFLFIQKDI